MRPGKLFVGTSGWSYRHWEGCFYPSDVRPSAYLEYYVTQFDCVELNACFYRLPTAKVVQGWAERTPRRFTFCPKMSRWVTHVKKLNDVDDSVRLFLERFAPLQAKMGPVLIQLPPNLAFHREKAEPFLALLSAWRKKFRFALEARHPSWIAPDVFEMLSDHNVAWVIADSGGFYPAAEAVTADFVYLRFHGPDSLYASHYTRKTLVQIAKKAEGWLREGKDVFAFFNNDAEGFAVTDAKTFLSMV